MIDQPFFIPAVIVLLISLPLIPGMVPPNRIYGVRTIETLADEQQWYQVNRYGGSALVVSSLLYLLVAALYPSVVAGETDFGRWIIHLVAFAGPLAVALLAIRQYLRQR